MFSQRQVYVLYSIDFCSRILIPTVFGQCCRSVTFRLIYCKVVHCQFIAECTLAFLLSIAIEILRKRELLVGAWYILPKQNPVKSCEQFFLETRF
jgi:hypothetical protein